MLPPDVIASTIYRLTVLAVVATVAWKVRERHLWPILVIIVCGSASNGLYLTEHLSLAGIVGVPYVGCIGWVLVDYMRHDPSKLRALLGRKEAAWSRERHDLMNDNAALRARLHTQSD